MPQTEGTADMRLLLRRLSKLEAGFGRLLPASPRFASFQERFAAVEMRMRPLLSAEDWERWVSSAAERPQGEADMLSRWNDAFTRATFETRQPFLLSMEDRWGEW